jgi:acylphosphatase
MQSNGKIILTGNFKNTGFGFSCLHRAISMNLKGTFEYLTETSVIIIIFGEKSTFHDFLKWCLSQPETSKGQLQLYNSIETYSDFEIINQI